MIVDSSALIAIYNSEADAKALWNRIYSSTSRLISAATYLEAGIVAIAPSMRLAEPGASRS